MIGFCPVTLLAGGLTLIDFGFAAFFNIVLKIFLQDPLEMGGYGLSPTRNAECMLLTSYLTVLTVNLHILAVLFCLWFGILAAQFYGHFANGRIPL